MTEDKLHQVALSLIPKVGPTLSRQLINYFSTPQVIFNTPKGKLAKVPGVGEKLASLIPNQKELLVKAEQIINDSIKKEIQIHYYKEASFPARLLNISDAPIVLYAKGKAELNPVRTIGIVGTRKATKYGLQITEDIVGQIKAHDATIISGLAYGIDVKAHEASLHNQIPTIGALANGLDKVYPSGNRNVAAKMLEQGGLVSEYPIGTEADPRLFPARNRIIAGLSDALIVVEAAKKGGALISANIADSYNVPVFAVPGEIGKTYSEGCNYLIRNFKASIFTSFKDVVEALNWDIQATAKTQSPELKYKDLQGDEKKIVEILLKNGQQMHIDQLCWQSQLSMSQLASTLLQMEFAGFIKPLPGKEFRLV
ncbi:MAG: DNA-protecting protein DprA [Cytophagales bacterium CG12_big_fil_rev_8_21_14_0_65_40_12]|nr:MAG: DNA-protecting protein DprA [Cytophagales bacterium CG12_big_fil_rev_8_21_14_0_65_40_12]PIW05967.1 MAG: DNA-protecting protein DprA [Cytophagales bacterium CG17_big_fil_post_rev_8_21_14_2_50_40_13]